MNAGAAALLGALVAHSFEEHERRRTMTLGRRYWATRGPCPICGKDRILLRADGRPFRRHGPGGACPPPPPPKPRSAGRHACPDCGAMHWAKPEAA